MDIREDLSRKITNWLENNPQANLQNLAEKSSLSLSTLRRIERMEVSPSVENTVQLLEVVASIEEAKEFLRARLDKNLKHSQRDFREDLRCRITYWLENRPHANLQVLARLSGVSYSTLRRIEQKEVTASLENTAQLLEVLGTVDEAKDFLCRHFSDLSFLLRKEAPKEALRAAERCDEFLLQVLASGREGLQKDIALQRLGERAEPVLASMCQAGLLLLREDRYFSQRPVPADPAGHLRHLNWLLEAFDRRSLEGWGSVARFRCEGLNLEALKAAHLVLNECLRKLDLLLQDPLNLGPYMMGYGIVSSNLSPWDPDVENSGHLS